MPEALWIQASGVDYSAAEDRRLISAIYNPGVINGLTISGGIGLTSSVAAGRAIVSDGAGGCYLCYFDTSTTVSGLTANAVSDHYVTVNPTTGLATIAKGVAPTNPSLRIGSVTTNATTVTTTSNSRATATSPVQGSSSGAGAVYYRSGVGFSQHVLRDAADPTWKTLQINRTGTPNTATYGNYVGTGDYTGMLSAGTNTLNVTRTGHHQLSAMVRLTPPSAVGAIAVRIYSPGLAGSDVLAQTYQPIFEDHVGSEVGIGVSWSGQLQAGVALQVQVNPYTDVAMDCTMWEVNWAKSAELAGGVTF